ncbi:MAG: nucleotidyltransferase, partial [Ferruginibacter sp.]
NLKSDFFISIIAEDIMHQPVASVAVIPCSSQWFGVTYKEDAPVVKASVNKLVAGGEYPPSLWK